MGLTRRSLLGKMRFLKDIAESPTALCEPKRTSVVTPKNIKTKNLR